MPFPRRFPLPWSVEDIGAAYVVKNNNGQKLAYVYYEEEPGRHSAARPLLNGQRFSSNARHSLYARDPSAAPDDWHRASSLAAQSVICEMTCARSCGVVSQAHELSIPPNRATLTQRGVVRIVTSSAHLKDAADLRIHFGLDTNAMAEKDFLMIG
jgi:hypothetical protein